MPAPARRILIRRLSPDCNVTGSSLYRVSWFLHGYGDKAGEGIHRLASHETTAASRRVLEVGERAVGNELAGAGKWPGRVSLPRQQDPIPGRIGS